MKFFSNFLSLALLSLFYISNLSAQDLPPRTPSPFNIKQIHAGHSLTDPLFFPWPGQFVELVASKNNTAGWLIMNKMVGKATLPGAWITNHWNYTSAPCWPDCYDEGVNPRLDIGKWELLVITENFEGPADNTLNSSRENLSLFVNHAWNNGNNKKGTPTMLWTNWPAIDESEYFQYFEKFGIPKATDGSSSGWRKLLDFMEEKGVNNQNGWQRMQDYANANRPQGCPPVYIIPGNRMMARFYDDIQKGLVPGIQRINQIFTDGVHTNNIGSYMVTAIHYACIFGKTPVGLPNKLMDGAEIPANLATYIQNMVWDVVTKYPRSGVVAGITNLQEESDISFNIYPNPANTFVQINTKSSSPIFIYNILGSQVAKIEQDNFAKGCDVSNLPEGIYTVVQGNSVKKLSLFR